MRHSASLCRFFVEWPGCWGLAGSDAVGVSGRLRNPSTRHRQVNGLLPAETGVESPDASLFFQLSPQRGRRSASPFREPFNLLIDLFCRHRQRLAARNFIQHQSAGHRRDGRFALRNGELTLTSDHRPQAPDRYRVRVYDEWYQGAWKRAMTLVDVAATPPTVVQYYRVEP